MDFFLHLVKFVFFCHYLISELLGFFFSFNYLAGKMKFKVAMFTVLNMVKINKRDVKEVVLIPLSLNLNKFPTQF